MRLYFSAVGTSGAEMVANLKGTLDSYSSYFMIYTIPPYTPQRPTSATDYISQALGYATIPAGAFELSGTNLAYAPQGGVVVPITYSGRANWFILEVPAGQGSVVFWRGNGELLSAGQQYVISGIEIPLAEEVF